MDNRQQIPLVRYLLASNGTATLHILSMAETNRRLVKHTVLGIWKQGRLLRGPVGEDGVLFDVSASTLVYSASLGVLPLKELVKKTPGIKAIYGFQEFPVNSMPSILSSVNPAQPLSVSGASWRELAFQNLPVCKPSESEAHVNQIHQALNLT
jgi:hypothetical protein